MHRLRCDLYMDRRRAGILPRQEASQSTQALQGMQAGEERTSCGDRSRPGFGGETADRGSGELREMRRNDDRSFLSFARPASLLPLMLPGNESYDTER